MNEEIIEKFLISKEDLQKYFNNRKMINKEEYIKYLYDNKNQSDNKVIKHIIAVVKNA
jgi:hypothetical protein